MFKKSFYILLVAAIIFFAIPIQSAQCATATKNITASKDKFVDGTGGYDCWNSGSNSWLYVGSVPGYGVSISALGFSLSNVPVNATKVLLAIPLDTAFYDVPFSIYGSANDSWNETDSSLPSADELLVSDTMAAHSDGSVIYKFYDVTSFIMTQKGGDGYASFRLTGPTSGDSYFSMRASEDGTYKPYLKVTYTMSTSTVSSAASLTENNLETTDVTVTLEDETFADSSLSAGSFTTNSSYVSVASVTYHSNTSCTLRLTNNRTDFDSNFTFNISIIGSELSTGASLTTQNSLTVAATADSESISAATDGDGIRRLTENGEQITVNLSGGVFVSSLTKENWYLVNFPSGVSIGSVSRTSGTQAVITLSGNASSDGAPITDAYVRCSGSEYDEGGTALSSGNLTIESPDDDPPEVSVNNTLTLDEGASEFITSGYLSATDPDSSNTSLSYTLTTAPASGKLTLTDVSTLPITTFTQADINNGLIRYLHDGSDSTSDFFVFTVKDPAGNSLSAQVFRISITPVDDTAPDIVLNDGLTIIENSNSIINFDNLIASDTECVAAQILYKVTTAPQHGFLCYDTAPSVPVTSFYEGDLYDTATNKVYYYHDGSETASDIFNFSIEDPNGNKLAGQTFSIQITSYDDTPPVVTVNKGITVYQGATVTINGTIAATDTECTDGLLNFTVNTYDAGIGHFSSNSFSQTDISVNSIKYIAQNMGTDTVSLRIKDTNNNSVDVNYTVTVIAPTPTPTPVQTPAPTTKKTSSGYTSSTDTPSPTLAPSQTATPEATSTLLQSESSTSDVQSALSTSLPQTPTVIAPKSVTHEDNGTVTVTINTADLPEGTKALSVNGNIVNIEGESVTVELLESDLNGSDSIEIFALNDELIAFGSVSVPLAETTTVQNADVLQGTSKNIPGVLIILAGVAAIAVIWSLIFMKKKSIR